MATDEPDRKITLLNKLCYGVSNFSCVSCSITLYGVFLLEVVQILPAYSSAILTACHVVGGVLNPVIGYLVDRTNTRWGKIKPWLAASVLPICASALLMWYSPEFGQTGKLVWYLFFACAMYGTLVAFSVPTNALVMLATDDQKERDSLNLYAIVIGSFGQIAQSLIQSQVLAAYGLGVGIDPCHNTTNGTGPDVPLSVQKTAYMVLASSSVGIFVPCALAIIFGVPERKVTRAAGDKSQSWNPFKMSKDIFSFRPFVYVLLMLTFINIGTEIELGTVAIACQYTYGLQNETANILLAFTITTVLALIPCYFFMQRFGRKALLFCGVLVFIVPQNIVNLIMSRELFGDSLEIVAYAAVVWAGVGGAAISIYPFLMTDVLDAFYLQTGKRMEAVFYSVLSCCLVIVDAIALGATQLFLQFVDYDPNQCVQPDSVGTGFRYISTVAPIASYAIALFFLWLYPITETTRRETAQALKIKKGTDETSALLPQEPTVQSTV